MAKKEYGNWKILESLDEGGQSYIYIVRNSESNNDKKYVLKRLKNLNRIERFIREIKIIEKVKHRNIVEIIDFNYKSDKPYLVTKHYPKGNLKNYDFDSLNLIERLQLFYWICEGVAEAHRNGVIHRDLKPENIFIDEDLIPVVGDFGISFIDDSGNRFTLSGEAVGPINYIAPELEDGRIEDITPASDIYSLGKILYWLISGKIFSREKHRQDGYDISKDQKEPAFYIINELLDQMIVANPELRIKNASNLLTILNETIERIKMKAHVIDKNAPQLCIYCCKGNYKVVVDSAKDKHGFTSLNNFGFQAVGSPKWDIFVCDHCGNVQIFRTDYAKDQNIWNRS